MNYVTGKTEHGQEWIRCLKCGRTSFNANDIKNKYCGACRQFHETVEQFKTDGCKCPNCGKLLDAATRASGDGKPEEGSLSVCLYCSNWNVFTDGNNLRAMSEDEIADLPQDIFDLLVKASNVAKKVRDNERRKK